MTDAIEDEPSVDAAPTSESETRAYPASIVVPENRSLLTASVFFGFLTILFGVYDASTTPDPFHRAMPAIAILFGTALLAFAWTRWSSTRLVIDDRGILVEGSLFAAWGDVAHVCPTPFGSPAEEPERLRPTFDRLRKRGRRPVSLYIRLRDPDEFWRRSGQRGRGPSIVVQDLDERDLPVPIEQFLAALKARTPFVLYDLAEGY